MNIKEYIGKKKNLRIIVQVELKHQNERKLFRHVGLNRVNLGKCTFKF